MKLAEGLSFGVFVRFIVVILWCYADALKNQASTKIHSQEQSYVSLQGFSNNQNDDILRTHTHPLSLPPQPLLPLPPRTCTHLSTQIFAVSFWSNEESINANLALAIATLLLIPYLIFIENTSVSLIKDLVATALILQILLGVVINGNL